MTDTVLIPNAGESTCPMCNRHWLVTPFDDCCLPACGCYGSDTSAANPARPCEDCGITHAYTCKKQLATLTGGPHV